MLCQFAFRNNIATILIRTRHYDLSELSRNRIKSEILQKTREKTAFKV